VLEYTFKRFDSLTGREMYDVLRARQAVFVLEQTCLYPDIDDWDPASHHLLGRDADGQLVAYLRLLPPGSRYPEASLGRVLTTTRGRKQGFGRQIMNEGIRLADELFPESGIRLPAQCYLERFYRELGFETVSAPFDEDGIPHVEMVRKSPPR